MQMTGATALIVFNTLPWWLLPLPKNMQKLLLVSWCYVLGDFLLNEDAVAGVVWTSKVTMVNGSDDGGSLGEGSPVGHLPLALLTLLHLRKTHTVQDKGPVAIFVLL